jgi:ORF6N domain-containing protein
MPSLDAAWIEQRIYVVRGVRVMLDDDLAALYGVLTKRLNEQVRRNRRRFPSDFLFELTLEEVANLKSQFATSSLAGQHGGRRKAVSAFTEQGVAMLSSVLHSDRAIDVNIAIMRTFVRLRHALHGHAELAKRIDELEQRYDGQFQVVFDALRELTRLPDDLSRPRVGFSD